MAIRGILLDLDGTIYWGQKEVAGASGFVREQQEAGIRCLFVTNRSNRTPERIRDQLGGYGIACETGDILTSGQATAQYIGSGKVYCVGEDGLVAALEEAGLTVTDESAGFVVVSFDRFFTYDKMTTACRLIDGGARYIATNPDRCLRTEDGLVPGTGAIVASVTAGCGIDPVVIGKPERFIFDMAVKHLGMDYDQVIAVGDNLDTDIPAGHRAGIRTVLMLTGISSRDDLDGAAVKPTWVAENFAELSDIIKGDNR
ncbi:HAD-IIA family hydrolase [Verrucomicrobiota bacterium]